MKLPAHIEKKLLRSSKEMGLTMEQHFQRRDLLVNLALLQREEVQKRKQQKQSKAA